LTVIVRNYATQIDMNQGKRAMNQQLFRAVHTDIIPTGFKVTFDDIIISVPRIEMTAGEFIDNLMEESNIFQKPSTLARFRTLLRI